MGIFVTILGWFTGRKTRGIAWALAGGLVAVLFVYWAITTINAQRKEIIAAPLRAQNEQQAALIEAMQTENKNFLGKVEAIADTMETLNRKIARNADRRQQSFDSMTGDATQKPDGSGIDTQPLEDKANTGMNAVFDNLEVLSREHLDEQAQ